MILYLTRYYLPATAAAGIRAGRFVEALVKAGQEVTVVTTGSEPELRELGGGLTICRIGPNGRLPSQLEADSKVVSGKLGDLPGPDPDGEISRALFAAAQVLQRRRPFKLIIASYPPAGLLKVAEELSHIFQIPLVSEFRDAWFTGMPWPYRNRRERRLAKITEEQAIKSSQAVIAVTAAHREILRKTYPDSADKIYLVRHGFENPQSKIHLESAIRNPQSEMRLVYTGQLHGLDEVGLGWLRKVGRWAKYHFLGAGSGNRLRLDWMSPHYLIEALGMAARRDSAFARSVRLIFVGRKYPQIDAWARNANLSGQVIQLGPQSPEAARDQAQDADLLLLNLYGIKGLEHHWCVPSKAYEYLATGKPILGLLPPGEARDLILQAGTGVIAPPDQPAQIAQVLLDLFQQHLAGGISRDPDWEFIEQFALPRQQEIFINLINKIQEK